MKHPHAAKRAAFLLPALAALLWGTAFPALAAPEAANAPLPPVPAATSVESVASGLRLYAPEGSPVVAALDGVVVNEDPWGGPIGYYLELLSEDGTLCTYAHLSALSVEAGDSIEAGQEIGTVGTSGLAEAGRPLCRFTMEKDGLSADLSALVPEAG